MLEFDPLLHQQIRDKERGYTVCEPDLEFKLPDSGEMNRIFWVWDHHTRFSFSWPQLEPLAITRYDVELVDSISKKGGCSAFVSIHNRYFQTPY